MLIPSQCGLLCGGPVSNNQLHIISSLLILAREFMILLRIGHWGTEDEDRRESHCDEERGGGTEDIKCEHWADLIEKPWNGGMGTKLDQREKKSCFCFGAAYKRNGESDAGGNIF